MAFMTWQVALAVLAVLFALSILWRVRPVLGGRRVGVGRRTALADARARVAAATSTSDRAVALCDAADARLQVGGSLTSALGYYVRAMRTDPSATEPVLRAARGLARRPRALETLLWRRLAVTPWEGATRAAAIAELTELQHVYAGSLRNRVRAKAVGQLLVALGQPQAVQAVDPPPSVEKLPESAS
jgi:hypothetical protein